MAVVRLPCSSNAHTGKGMRAVGLLCSPNAQRGMAIVRLPCSSNAVERLLAVK
jgi:hypothetical protein